MTNYYEGFNATEAINAYNAGDKGALDAFNIGVGAIQPGQTSWIASSGVPGLPESRAPEQRSEQMASPSLFPGSLPSMNLANPVVTPVSASTPGASPAAAGFEMFQAMLENVLNTERLRQSAIDQQVNIANLFAQLGKASPSQAANLAVQLGIPGLEPDLSYANAFAGPSSTGIFGGKVGSQDIRLPFAFSGKELNFLGNNPNVASGISDIAGAIGRPDFLKNSFASLIPTNTSLAGAF